MPIHHTIVQGDSVSLLAKGHGLAPETIWNDPANEELRGKREHMNILFPGDVLVIPDKRVEPEAVATGKTHVFRRVGVPMKFRVRVSTAAGPVKARPYLLRRIGRLRALAKELVDRFRGGLVTRPFALDLLAHGLAGKHERYPADADLVERFAARLAGAATDKSCKKYDTAAFATLREIMLRVSSQLNGIEREPSVRAAIAYRAVVSDHVPVLIELTPR